MGIPVDGRVVSGVRARDGRLEAVLFADGGELPREGLLVQAPLEQRNSFADDLGLDRTQSGAVAVNALGKTSRPHVWAAGDVSGAAPQSVAMAIASGSAAAAGIAHALAEARAERAAEVTAEPHA